MPTTATKPHSANWSTATSTSSTCLANGQPAPNQSLLFQLGDRHDNGIDCDFLAFQTKTDNQGRFVFPQVPPGDHQVAFLVTGTDDAGHTYWMHRPLKSVTIEPRQTTTVTIDTPEVPNSPAASTSSENSKAAVFE